MANGDNDLTATGLDMLSQFRKCVPRLTSELHKGQCGRIGVIGGSHDYSGAPYYVAMTALRLGADLSHVFCTKEIAPSIRAYSPDIIVHSTLDAKDASDTTQWFPRLHSIAVGPGLGRDPTIFKRTIELVEAAKEMRKILVFDADSIHLLAQNHALLKDYNQAVLTPNKMEYRVLVKAAGIDDNLEPQSSLKAVSEFFGGCAILLKGAQDIIYSKGKYLSNPSPVALSRCGGQGDLLSAAVAVFTFWAQSYHEHNHIEGFDPMLAGAYAASVLVRAVSKKTFDELGRSMVASDMLRSVPDVFKQMFEQ